jgi:hypothetical protein
MPTMHVEFDSLRAQVRAGGVAAPYAASGHRGEVRLGGDAGPLMRPVTFGERSAAAGDALTATSPRSALCGALRLRATVEVGAGATLPAELLDCVVLAMAGADDERAPSFADSALIVLRETGGELTSVLDAPAREVDRLAIALHGEAGDVLGGPAVPALTLAGVRDLLAAMLLFRAAAPARRTAPSAVVVPFPHRDEPAVQTWDPAPELPPAGGRSRAR